MVRSMPSLKDREVVERYADGALIVSEGEDSREMYVIRSGQVAITKTIDGQEVRLAVLSKGNFFGEMSLLESLPRDANARAIGSTEVLVIRASGLLVRIRRDPTFAFEMLYRLSGRIRSLNQRVSAMVALQNKQNRAVASEDILLFQGELDRELEPTEAQAQDLR